MHLNGDVAEWDWLLDSNWLASVAALEAAK